MTFQSGLRVSQIRVSHFGRQRRHTTIAREDCALTPRSEFSEKGGSLYIDEGER